LHIKTNEKKKIRKLGKEGKKRKKGEGRRMETCSILPPSVTHQGEEGSHKMGKIWLIHC
jgi:hypothetical protein